MPDLKYTTSKGMFLLSVAVFVLCARTAVAKAQPTIVDLPRLSRSRAVSPRRRSSSILPWPNRSPRGGWRLFNIVLRTCTSCRCSAQMLWLSRRASDTFISESTMPPGCGQMRVVNQSS